MIITKIVLLAFFILFILFCVWMGYEFTHPITEEELLGKYNPKYNPENLNNPNL